MTSRSARIAEGGIDVRIAAVWNIPVACNVATADYLVSSPLLNNGYRAERPDLLAG